MVMELSKTDAWSHWRNDMSRTRICKSCEKPFMSRGALRNHMLNNTGEKRVLGFVTSVKIVNIYCVVVHKSEERLVQVSDTLEVVTLGFTILLDQPCLCGGTLLSKRAQFPRIRATDSFWKGRLISTDSSSPFWRALAFPSFFTSLIALLCQAPSDSTAMGHVKKTEPEAWSHWREANLGTGDWEPKYFKCSRCNF